MATMKLYELVNHYHIGTELTCAEAMFMACNEYYHLNLSEETRKMFSVMGIGKLLPSASRRLRKPPLPLALPFAPCFFSGHEDQRLSGTHDSLLGPDYI